MKPMRNTLRTAFAALLLAGAAFGATTARAADDSSTVTAVLGMFGVDMNNSGQKIDYRERPKLVVPPNRQNLPEPQSADARPDSWPVDQGAVLRQGARVAKSSGASADEPARANLTQPPEGYRRPSQDLAKVNEAEAKPAWWKDPMGSLSQAVGWGK
jgi:hypothetical protein